MGRAAALLAIVVALAAYDSLHARLWNASDWGDVAFIAVVLIPLSFSIIWFLLPLRTARGLLPAGMVPGALGTQTVGSVIQTLTNMLQRFGVNLPPGIGVLAWAFHVAGWNTAENFCKLFGVTFVGFAFLPYFETLSWVVLVALIIPWVDAYSVWRGPTKVIVTHHEHVFTALSYAFPIPGEHTAANLGVPDLLFFSLFLGAAARFRLRTGWTWVALTLSFGVTIAAAVAFKLAGLPALPLLSLGFLLPNADLLWTRLRAERAAADDVPGS